MNPERRDHCPSLPLRLLRRMSPFSLNEACSGDLEEEFRMLRESRGRTCACLWIWLQMLKTLPAYFKSSLIWRMSMLMNTIRMAARIFRRHKGFSFINVLGLALGVGSCFLIFLWVQDELSYDRFHDQASDLYAATFSNGSIVTPTALAPFLKSEVPDVIAASRYDVQDRPRLKSEDAEIFDDSGIMVDPEFLLMFTIPFVDGNPETALRDPHSILLSENLARKLFGTADATGRTLTFGLNTPLKVTAVFENYPRNSHIAFDFIVPMSLAASPGRNLETWEYNNIRTYVLLRHGTPAGSVDAKISDAVTRHRPQDKRTLSLQPVTRLHLNPFQHTNTPLTYVYLFSSMALFILLIACINFVNLATARASARAREIGVRKTVGALRAHLIRQFFGESLVMTLAASAAGLGLAGLLLPLFNNLTEKFFTWGSLVRPPVLAGLFGIVLLTGLVAGGYPALFLSRFQAVRVLKGKAGVGSKGTLFRRILVVFQFSLSGLLILATLMVYKQIHFMRGWDLGFERDNVLYFDIGSRFQSQFESVKAELLAHPDILSITRTNLAPYGWNTNAGAGDVHWEGKMGQRVPMVMTSVDYDYLDTFGLAVTQGRFFSRDLSTDASEAFVVNEAAVGAMEMDTPVGKELRIWDRKGRIIGVVKDYHFDSLHDPVLPMAMRIDPDGYFQACLRISPRRVPETLALLQRKWKEIYPELPFRYRFLDEAIQGQYRTDERTGEIASVFTILAIGISCLGIFGLSSYTTQRRTKEIGVRKVLGASVPHIVKQISKEFVWLVVFANVIAWPLAYYVTAQWLRTFAYRTAMDWWIFPLTGIGVLLLSFLTISGQILRAAVANPVDSLRYE